MSFISKAKRILSLCFYNFLLILFSFVDFTKWLIALIKQSSTFVLRKPFTIRSPGNEKRDWSWGQKFGLVAKDLSVNQLSSDNKTIMIHCASVGEVVAAMPLIKRLISSSKHSEQTNSSALNVIVTTNTKTGKEQLLRILNNLPDDSMVKNSVHHCYLPIDLPWLMSSLIKKINPELLIIMEVELWPNLINQCHKKQIPVVIVNARLTDKTKRGYQKFNALTQPMIQQLHKVYARNQMDFDNYLAMGIKPEKLTLLGNIKFDIEPADMRAAQELRDALNLTKRKVIIAGSSHEGEESLLVEAYQQFKTQYPDLILLICPRHPERFTAVFEYLTSQQLNVVKMSERAAAENSTDVLLGDQMGQLSKLYGVCDIAFVGGSFAKRGGHNPIEAAAFAKPIIMGPHVYNNPEICNTLANDGGLVIANTHFEFITQMNLWLSDSELTRNTGKKALATLHNNAGIINTLSTELLRTLNTKNEAA